jgi:hypothetical protein
MAVQKRQESDPDYTFDNFKRGQQAV